MITWLQPRHFERRYGNFLKKTNAQLKKEFLLRLGLIIKLQTLISYQESLEDDTELKANQEKLKEEENNLFLWWLAFKPQVFYTVSGYFSVVNLYNDKQFQAVVKNATGLSIPPTRTAEYTNSLYSSYNDIADKFGDTADIYRNEPFLDGVEKNWKTTQESYIDKTVTQTIIDSISIIRGSLITADVAKTILNKINAKFETVDKNLVKFGSDQIDRLDSQLNAKRQQSLGLKDYVWDTQKDERVRGNPNGLYPNARPSHYSRQGLIFSWNNPPEGGAPGEAAGCRCRPKMRLPR